MKVEPGSVTTAGQSVFDNLQFRNFIFDNFVSNAKITNVIGSIPNSFEYWSFFVKVIINKMKNYQVTVIEKGGKKSQKSKKVISTQQLPTPSYQDGLD